MKIYLLPGLGFDHRIFRNLNLSCFDYEYLDWIEPKSQEEISSYAKRISNKLETGIPIVLIGHSLGGIIAQEIANLIPVDKIFLISSIKSRKENTHFFKLVRPLFLHLFFTKKITVKTLKFWGQNHGYESEEEQALVKNMVAKQSDHYLQWALKTLSDWNPLYELPKTMIIQIHGDRDKTFPIKRIDQANYIIKDAGHFMVFKKPIIISEIIQKELLTLRNSEKINLHS